MKQLAAAILKVMGEVKGIEKNMNVGSGNYGYKGVSDKDVKNTIGESMRKNGLTLLPVGVEDKTELTTWEDNGRQKQSIFTKVKTEYLLLHESGENMRVSGYGHGVDNQDKGAGKATTYALKNTLLYMFLVPTGTIDDTDKTHSNDLPTPPVKTLPALQPNTKEWKTAIDFLTNGYESKGVHKAGSIPLLLKKFTITKPNQELLKEQSI